MQHILLWQQPVLTWFVISEQNNAKRYDLIAAGNQLLAHSYVAIR